MKSPRSPRPSGDRKIAGLFISALEHAGFIVELGSEYRTWEGKGDTDQQQRIKEEAEKIADTIISQYLQRSSINRPDAWFTYHLYHKAPDWIGPRVCDALDIPYLVAEASIAQKQSGGPWDIGFTGSMTAIREAKLIFNLNPRDEAGLAKAINKNCRTITLLPFLDVEAAEIEQKNQQRRQLAAKLKIDPDKYWLLCVAMMRNDSKRESYAQLARSINRLERKDWLLLIVGSGLAEQTVRDYFSFDLDRRIRFLGKQDTEFVHQIMSASDLFVWPAIREAFGMVPLEALACGLPTVCGNSGGISSIVDHKVTGILVEQPESVAFPNQFAKAIERLLGQPSTMAQMSAASIERYRKKHQILMASEILKNEINGILSAE